MKIDPNQNPLSYNMSTEQRSATTDPKNTNASQKCESTSQFELSHQSQKLQKIKDDLNSQDSIDYEKVQDVKNRLKNMQLDIQQEGPTLEAISNRIADKIIQMDDFFSKD